MIKLENTTAYTVAEVAEILHKNRDTVLRYIHKGELKAKKVGRPFYITEKALEVFITGGRPQRRGNSMKKNKVRPYDFNDFMQICERGFDSGELRLENGKRMTEKDYAIYWSICMLREDAIAHGRECAFTKEDIFFGVRTYCGDEVFQRVFSEV